LKDSWSIAKAKSHNKRFKKAKRAFEGGLPFISFFDVYIVVAPLYVKFCKVTRFLELVVEFRD
jgi:hypothetical protein